MIRFACPCGQRFAIPNEHAGELVVCPTCSVANRTPTRFPDQSRNHVPDHEWIDRITPWGMLIALSVPLANWAAFCYVSGNPPDAAKFALVFGSYILFGCVAAFSIPALNASAGRLPRAYFAAFSGLFGLGAVASLAAVGWILASGKDVHPSITASHLGVAVGFLCATASAALGSLIGVALSRA